MKNRKELPTKKTLSVWRNHWKDEVEASLLYNLLADLEPESERKKLYRRFASMEDRHATLWKEILAGYGIDTGHHKPSLRVRLLGWFANKRGPSVLLKILANEESREVKSYLQLYHESKTGHAKDAALLLTQESAQHAKKLSSLMGRSDEPWHRAKSGGYISDVIYGFNDGLTANFGLVAGVIGAAVQSPFIIVTGVVGLIADSLSMASSSYLAAKSEQEVYNHEIEMERAEIELMPEVEEEEIALMYESRGLPTLQAEGLAKELMKNPEQALAQQIHDEFGISRSFSNPFRRGVITGFATAIGALIPVSPFFIWNHQTAIWISFSVAMVSHFIIGSSRSIFTGRGVIRSGIDMFLVGLGVAGIAYGIGELVSRWFIHG